MRYCFPRRLRQAACPCNPSCPAATRIAATSKQKGAISELICFQIRKQVESFRYTQAVIARAMAAWLNRPARPLCKRRARGSRTQQKSRLLPSLVTFCYRRSKHRSAENSILRNNSNVGFMQFRERVTNLVTVRLTGCLAEDERSQVRRLTSRRSENLRSDWLRLAPRRLAF